MKQNISKDDLNFMKAVYRDWGYYGEVAHQQANAIKKRLEEEDNFK